LNQYDDWLKKRVTGNPREQSIWWGETLREVLFEAGDLNSSDAPIKDWVKKARAYYRFKRRAKGLRRVCADKDQIYYLDRTRKQPIISKRQYNPESLNRQGLAGCCVQFEGSSKVEVS
jgi:hypothetical protein